MQSIFLSDDGGSTWQAVTGNLEQNANGTGNGPSVTWVEMLRVNNSWIYFAATSTGLYSTRLLDGMDTRWEPEGVNVIGNVVVDMIAVRPVDGQVAIGSHGRGLFVANAAEALVSATITVRPGSITFDTVLVNESRRESFTVANDARSQRPIAGRIELAEGEDFGIVSGDGPFSLAPGEEIDVVVECRPTKTGLLSGRATIVHDASNPTGDKAVFLTARGRSLTGVRAESGRIVSMEIGPNPVASSATLRIAVEKADRYLLQIHDESGRLVGTIHDGHLEAGQHEIRFDCSSLFTGAYVLSLVDAERVGLRETPFVVQH